MAWVLRSTMHTPGATEDLTSHRELLRTLSTVAGRPETGEDGVEIKVEVKTEKA